MIGLPQLSPNLKIVTALSVAHRIANPRVSKVTIPITYECNQRCKTCGIWSTYLKNPSLKAEEIRLQEFARFCRMNNLLWIAFTGGEPFLRTDMGLILEEAMENCRMVSITTNGFSPEKVTEDVRFALRADNVCHLAINVSMNGSEKVHDEISGIPGSFAQAKMTLQYLRGIPDSRLSVGVSYTSSVYNKWEFPTYLREMDDLGIGLEHITFGMGQDSPSYYQGNRGKTSVSPGQDYVTEFSKKILKDLHVGLDPLKWVSRKYLEGFTKGFQNGHSPKCVAGQYSLMLDPFWNVYPCMFYCPSKPCGNLRGTDFIIKNLDLRGCEALVRTCPGCWTPCESYSTLIFRPWRCL